MLLQPTVSFTVVRTQERSSLGSGIGNLSFPNMG